MITSRGYAHADLDRVLRFLAALHQNDEMAGIFHAGDFLWRTYSPQSPRNWAQDVHLWEEDGQLIGFTWTAPGDYGEYFLRGRFYGAAVEQELLTWLEQRTLAGLEPGDSVRFETGGPTANPSHPLRRQKERALIERGYARVEGDVWVQMLYQHDDLLPAPPLPDGFTLSSHGEGVSIGKLIENRPQHDPKRYRALTELPRYDAELGLAVVAPDGTVAAFCICWFDPYSSSGQFEPVGTLPSFQRLGLGKALMHEGIKRLRERGAVEIFVCPREKNEAALGLYRAAGFEVVEREQTWAKTLVK